MVNDVGLIHEIATQLRIYGITLAIDDFGEGYSSFARLRELPFGELKLDRGFVEGCAGDARNAGICRAIIELAHQFGVSAVAEGLEDVADIHAVRDMGCDIGQGYFFARPMPKSKFISLLGEQRGRAPTMVRMNDRLPAPRDLGSEAPRRCILDGPRRPAPRTTGDPAERVRSLEAARSINQRLFETSLDLIVIVDRWGNIIRVSPSAEAILGYRPAELVGESAVKLLYPDDLESTRNEMRLARRGRTRRNFDCRYVHKDGQHRDAGLDRRVVGARAAALLHRSRHDRAHQARAAADARPRRWRRSAS